MNDLLVRPPGGPPTESPWAGLRSGLRGRHSAAAWMRRLAKYGVVGLSGISVVLALFWLARAWLGLPVLAAALLANEAAVCSNYLLNNNWTFADRRAGFATLPGLLRYHAAAAGGIALNLVLLAVLTEALALPVMPAQLASVLITTVWNISINICWTWGPPGRVAIAHPVPPNGRAATDNAAPPATITAK